jgi:hypothetical protein
MKLACFYYASRGFPIENPVETKALQRSAQPCEEKDGRLQPPSS